MMEGYLKQQALLRKLQKKQNELLVIKTKISSEDQKSADSDEYTQRYINDDVLAEQSGFKQHVPKESSSGNIADRDVIAKLSEDDGDGENENDKEREQEQQQQSDNDMLLRTLSIVAQTVPDLPDEDSD